MKRVKKLLNIIWPAFIIISVLYAFIGGNIEEVSNGIFESSSSAVELTITFFGTICLWNGIMEIAKRTSLMDKITKLLRPLIHFLFPELKNNKQANEEISMNMVANILGLGNAATPLGLKAMETMQEKNVNKERLSNSMAMLIVINTASLEVIPTTVIAVRTSLNSVNPTSIIIPVWIATIAAFSTVVILSKILSKKW